MSVHMIVLVDEDVFDQAMAPCIREMIGYPFMMTDREDGTLDVWPRPAANVALTYDGYGHVYGWIVK